MSVPNYKSPTRYNVYMIISDISILDVIDSLVEIIGLESIGAYHIQRAVNKAGVMDFINRFVILTDASFELQIRDTDSKLREFMRDKNIRISKYYKNTSLYPKNNENYSLFIRFPRENLDSYYMSIIKDKLSIFEKYKILPPNSYSIEQPTISKYQDEKFNRCYINFANNIDREAIFITKILLDKDVPWEVSSEYLEFINAKWNKSAIRCLGVREINIGDKRITIVNNSNEDMYYMH